MKKNILPIILLSLMASPFARSQNNDVEILSLQECIDLGLENNPAIKIIGNREQIARNNHSYEPFLPSLGATGRLSNSNTNSRRPDASGGEREFNGSKSSQLSGGLSFTWRVFDGLGMFADYEKSALMLSASEIQTRQTVENMVLNISNYYYQIFVQQHRVQAAEKTLVLSKERYRIIDEQVNIGSASGLERHQARLDLNTDSSNVVRQIETLRNLYIQMNTLMNIDMSLSMYISDTIIIGTPLVLADLEFETRQNNTALIASSLGISQTQADLKIARAARFPTLDLSAGYSYSRSETPSSISTFSQSNGFNYGVDLTIPIFNGFRVDRNIRNTKLELDNQRLSYDETELQLISDLHMLYNTYSNNLLMIDFENQNMEVTLVNLDLALERYELGALSGLDFREFQLSYLNAVDRLLTAMYQAKANELSLLILSGRMEEFLKKLE
ncbi:MAG: TolC family protein [Cytophagaceae bacterium]|jgi:outer membrane protein TolC|nr:TolC family protein [Cytophagaceae bacterium]